MAVKFYAVKNGKKPGVYRTWAECEEQVKGFSGAVYKSFSSEDEAAAFVRGDEHTAALSCEATAYTDGSYDVSDGRFSYGVVLFRDGEKLTFSAAFSDPELSSMRNVAGEIKGAEFAMRYCVDAGIKSLEIFYDYRGVETWCTGEWKASKDGTKRYKRFYDSIKDDLSVKFTKVKGHSGNVYNDEADSLAKAALNKGEN